MVGLALICFALAVIAVMVAAQPKAAWRFKYWWSRKEPSDTQAGLAAAGWLSAAVAAVVFGVFALTMETPAEKDAREQQEEAECEATMTALQGAYDPADLEPLLDRAEELGVDLDIPDLPAQQARPTSSAGTTSLPTIPGLDLGPEVEVYQDGRHLGTIGGASARSDCDLL